MRKFGMFSVDGNKAVASMVSKAAWISETNKVKEFLREDMAKIAKDHGEVYDTVVREQIIQAVGREGISIFDING